MAGHPDLGDGKYVPHPEENFEADIKQKITLIISQKGGPGGCSTYQACHDFCEQEKNFDTCVSWARANGVWGEEEVEKAEDFHKKVKKIGGPGGCNTPEQCQAFCENPVNQEVCVNFAEEHGYISKEEARKARQGGPGGCKSEKQCREFCSQDQNIEVCLDFSVQQGHLSREDAQKIKDFRKSAKQKLEDFREPVEIDADIDKEKAKQILASQGGPGGCKTFEECGQFCDNPQNQKLCLDFAERHDLIKDKKEFEKIRKIVDEGGPGGCKGERQCREFCENPENGELCIDFAVKNGFMSRQEAERAKKGFKAFKDEGGPGGCKSPKQCQEFCEDPVNQENCFNFAKKHGFIEEKEVKKFEEVKNLRKALEEKGGPGGCRGPEQCRSFCENPDNQEACLNFASEHGGIDKEKAQRHIQEFKKYKDKEEQKKRYRQEFPGQGQEGFPGRGEFPGEGQYPGRGQEPGFQQQPQQFPSCPQGTYFDGTTKTCEPEADLQKNCVAHGGTWTGTYCKFPGQTSEPHPTYSPGATYSPYPTYSPGATYSPYPTYSPGSTYSPYPTYSPSSDPATECAKTGGTWDSVNHICKFPSPTATTSPISSTVSPSPTATIQTTTSPTYSPTSTQTYDPATECSKSGGTWTGSYCQYQTQTTYTPYPTTESTYSPPPEYHPPGASILQRTGAFIERAFRRFFR